MVYTLLEIIEIETHDDYYLNVNIYLFLETLVNLSLQTKLLYNYSNL